MNAKEKRKLENRLIVMGLKRLQDPELVPQMAALITSHEFFLGMLNECDEAQRSAMYEAIRPHLSFEPWPLDVYMAKLKEHASRMASRATPIEIGERKLREVGANQATGIVIDLKCHSCGRSASFYGTTIVTAVILARQDGWVRDRALAKETCPKCPSVERGERRKCPTCTRKHYAPDCRMISEIDERPERTSRLVS